MRLYAASWILPISSAPLRRGCVGVDEAGTIQYAGALDAAPPGEIIDLGESILLPGLINVHAHLDLTLLRGRVEEPDFFRWIRRVVELKGEFSSELLYRSAVLGVAEGVRAGITTYGDTSDSTAAARAMSFAGVRGVSWQEVFGPDPAQCDQAMSDLRERVDAVGPDTGELIAVGISPHAPYSVSDTLYAQASRYAESEGLDMALHIAESEAESQLVTEGAGPFAEFLRGRDIEVAPRARSSIALLERCGVLHRAPLLIHAVQVDEADIALISAAGARVAHCPVANARLRHGAAPAAAMLAAGIPLGFGSDSMAANNRMDILEEARCSALIAGAAGMPVLSPAELLHCATLGAARALRLDHLVGTLEAGKRADLAAFSLRAPGIGEQQDPETALIHTLRGSDAMFAMVAGRELLRGGELLFEVPDMTDPPASQTHGSRA